MEAVTVEDLFGVYMLYCENPSYRGRIYIGYTVDPNRRVQQHNKGKNAGGAWRTSNRGPWEMVLIIHGFPNDVSALRFEWAWQHPQRSRRLQNVGKKKSSENSFQFHIRILSHMLSVGPWNRLALTIQWLKPEYAVDFQPNLLPPAHMPFQYGPVISKKINLEHSNCSSPYSLCDVCYKPLENNSILQCVDASCTMKSHIICLSAHFLKEEPDRVLPLSGNCPVCGGSFLWADLIRKLKGCYQNTVEGIP